MKKILFLFLGLSSPAFAQGYLNPPVYATGSIYVQPGTKVDTVVRQAVNPNNINVYANGAITNWTVHFPSPAFDGQLIGIGCPGGTVTALSYAATSPDTVASGAPAACAGGTGIFIQFQYAAISQSWVPVGYNSNAGGGPFAPINSPTFTGTVTALGPIKTTYFWNDSITGTQRANLNYYNIQMNVNNDDAFPINSANMFQVDMQGGRGASTNIYSLATFSGPTVAGNPARFYTSTMSEIHVQSTDDPTLSGPVTVVNSAGNFYGMAGTIFAECKPPPNASVCATYLQSIGHELDVSAAAGSSLAMKYNLALIRGGAANGTDVVAGTIHDSFLDIGTDNVANAPVKYGISIGRPSLAWPFDATSIMFRAYTGGALGSIIDYSNVTCALDCVILNGFTVTNAGLVKSLAGFTVTNLFGTIASLETNGGNGFRWTLANNNTFTLQHTANGFSTATAPITIGADDHADFGGYIGLIGGAVPIFATRAAITSGAAASTATMTNAPCAGNPTKWIPIGDNGVTRYIPAMC